MKTTVEIPDELFLRARRKARQERRTLRSLIIDGLRWRLDERADEVGEGYRLPDLSVGDPETEDPLRELDWAELRDEIYGGR